MCHVWIQKSERTSGDQKPETHYPTNRGGRSEEHASPAFYRALDHTLTCIVWFHSIDSDDLLINFMYPFPIIRIFQIIRIDNLFLI